VRDESGKGLKGDLHEAAHSGPPPPPLLKEEWQGGYITEPQPHI
jgi:hypothetical protein